MQTDSYQTIQAENLASSIFKAYDIRGIVNQTLTKDVVFAIGKALGSEAAALGQQTVVIARDGRNSGPELSQALADGLCATGRQVIDIGRVPTPVLYFANFHLATGTGIMLTGSHNPPDYNGLKIVLDGETLSGERIQKIKQRIEQQDFISGEGSLSTQDISEAYLQKITSDITLTRPLNIVVDCGNGVAGELAPELYRRLGCQVTELYCDIDGNFPNHHPDPSQPETLNHLIETVVRTGADVGLAFDGDGDRLGVVSPSGEIIWPDRQMVLYAQEILGRKPGSEIIFDIKCSRNLAKAINDASGKPLMWKTGHSLVKAKLKETGAPLAGEMSGHIFFKDRWYGFDDALYTGARLLEILAQDQRAPLDIFNALPNMINTPELRLEMQEGEHYAFMEQIISASDFSNAEITTIDGLRVDFPEGWGLVRASNTTPCLVIRFEAESQAAIEEIQDQFRTLFLSLRTDLELPF